MQYLVIKKIHQASQDYLNKDITVAGWLRTIRSSKTNSFLELNDGSFFKSLQIVFSQNLTNYEEVIKLGPGASVAVKGQLVESPAAGQAFELLAKEITILGESEPDYPLQKKGHSWEFLRTIAHLRPRTNTFSAVFRLRSVLSLALQQFFHDEGFVYIHTPIIATSDCEGAGEMFQVTTLDLNKLPLTKDKQVDFSQDFFGKKAGLTVSGQLQAEAMIAGLNKVYTFGPTFRAENSNTSRHASEFWMLEPEMAMADLNDTMDLAEKMIKFMIDTVFSQLPAEMEFFNKFIDKDLIDRLQAVKAAKFERLSYSQAIDILMASQEKFTYPVSWGMDLQSEHERYLVEKALKKPAFVFDYPQEIKAFYMRLNDDKKTVAAVDLLVPGIGEIIGGSQREERYQVLKAKMATLDFDLADYQWYLDLRRFGTVPHAGFGLGFERALMYLTGMKNIRDVIPFPRTPKNAQF